MKLNAVFIKNIHATYGQEGKTWLKNLLEHLQRLSLRWNFQMVRPLHDLSYNFVAVVQLPSGLAILKTAPSQARLMEEATWLKAHKKCAPIIIHMDKENNAYLMEKLEPGTSLKSVVKEGNDEKATQIISQAIFDLQASKTLHQTDYQHISEHVFSFDFLHGHVDKYIIERAKSVFNDLCADRSSDVILHGDLHHDNILQNGTSWNVIDPHGYIGNPCAEVGPMIFNPLDCFPKNRSLQTIIEARLKILSEILPFGLQQITAWAFCLTLRSAAWDIEGFGVPNDHTLEIAKILNDRL